MHGFFFFNSLLIVAFSSPEKCLETQTICFCSFTEYVNLYVDYLLNKSIYQQFASFYHGFHSVCASNALIVSLALSILFLFYRHDS